MVPRRKNERTDRADLANFLVRASEWAELHPPLQLMGNSVPKRNPQSGSAAFLDRFSRLRRRLFGLSPYWSTRSALSPRSVPDWPPATGLNVSELSAIAYDNVRHG